MPSKPVWESKTLWVAVITAVAALIPAMQSFISANPGLFTAALTGVFALLRLLTNNKVDIG